MRNLVEPTARERLPDSLRYFLLGLWSSTGLTLIVTAIRCVLYGNRIGLAPLWFTNPGFDFFDYLGRFSYRHSARFFTFPGYPWYYPAPAIFFHYPFYRFAEITHKVEGAYDVYILTIILVAIGMSAGLGVALFRNGLSRMASALIAMSVLISWPMYFTAQRGNIEGLTWTVVAAGVWFFLSRRLTLAAFFIGLAGSVKIYPILFAALFLRRRERNRSFIVVISSFAVVTVLALLFLDPNFVYSTKKVLGGVLHWTRDYSELATPSDYDHSLFGLFKALIYPSGISLHHALRIYYLIAGPAALAVFFLGVRHKPVANQVLFLTCAAIVLPPTSFEYTLCLLYVPFAILAVAAVRVSAGGSKVKGLPAGMFLVGLSLAPDMFLAGYAPGLPGAVKAVVLLSLLLLSASCPFEYGNAVGRLETRAGVPAEA